MKRLRFLKVFFPILAILLFPSFVQTATFNVTTSEEFQNALNKAAVTLEDDLINLPDGQLETTVPFEYSSSQNYGLVINGAGKARTILSGRKTSQVLRIWTMQNWDTWRRQGIRINTVSPGPVETPILGDFLETLGERADEDMAVMGRAGKAEEIAPAVAFLCSDESRWMNGANIAIDGGMHAHILRNLHGF